MKLRRTIHHFTAKGLNYNIFLSIPFFLWHCRGTFGIVTHHDFLVAVGAPVSLLPSSPLLLSRLKAAAAAAAGGGRGENTTGASHRTSSKWRSFDAKEK